MKYEVLKLNYEEGVNKFNEYYSLVEKTVESLLLKFREYLQIPNDIGNYQLFIGPLNKDDFDDPQINPGSVNMPISYKIEYIESGWAVFKYYITFDHNKLPRKFHIIKCQLKCIDGFWKFKMMDINKEFELREISDIQLKDIFDKMTDLLSNYLSKGFDSWVSGKVNNKSIIGFIPEDKNNK